MHMHMHDKWLLGSGQTCAIHEAPSQRASPRTEAESAPRYVLLSQQLCGTANSTPALHSLRYSQGCNWCPKSPTLLYTMQKSMTLGFTASRATVCSTASSSLALQPFRNSQGCDWCPKFLTCYILLHILLKVLRVLRDADHAEIMHSLSLLPGRVLQLALMTLTKQPHGRRPRLWLCPWPAWSP